MTAVRRLLAHRRWATFLCLATLALKLLVPTGYMIGNESGRLTIELCSGMATPSSAMAMSMPMPGMHGPAADHGKSSEHGKAEMPCAFSGLSAAMLGAIDPIQLAALLLFVIAVGVAPIVPAAIARRSHLRPPLRAPPATL